jgi:glutamate synthase (NADPH/NADH) small chain
MYGIPNMKLDKKEVVLRRIKLMEQEGIKFICNANVGDNVEPQLSSRTSTPPSSAPAPPSRAISPSKAASSRACTSRWSSSPPTPRPCSTAAQRQPIHAKGKDVVVIGGGDTGTDCVGTSMRHGCKSLTQIEILPKPPLERAADNPWPEWPKVYKMDYGQEEAAAKFGADPRVYLTTVKKFIGDERQREGSSRVEIKWEKNDKGQFVPKEVARHRKDPPRAARAARHGLPRARAGAAQALNRPRTDARSNIKAEHGNTPPASRASSPPATAAAARASSSGPSTKAAAPPASATAT